MFADVLEFSQKKDVSNKQNKIIKALGAKIITRIIYVYNILYYIQCCNLSV